MELRSLLCCLLRKVIMVYCVCSVFMCAINVQAGEYNNECKGAQVLSFDSVSQDTMFKKIINACMHSWEDMLILVSEKENLNHETSMNRDCIDNRGLTNGADALIAHLIYTNFCIKKLGSDNCPLSREEIAYLMHIVEKMRAQAACLSSVGLCIDADRIACINQSLSTLLSTLRYIAC